MNNQWLSQNVSLKYMLSDITLFVKTLRLRVKQFEVIDPSTPAAEKWMPPFELENDEHGFLLRSQPLADKQPKQSVKDGLICYIPAQFDRCYIDLSLPFEEYKNKFSSKTRSTIRRKTRKFNDYCNQSMHFEVYKSVDELCTFYQLARPLSQKTYQEKLLDAGLPDNDLFRQEIIDKAQMDQARGYLLWNGNTPVAYMFCPAHNEVMLYQYLGFDPDYKEWSVGTILHWFVFEDLFRESKFRFFDFTEGNSEHKQLFSTGSILCGNIFLLKNTISMRFWVRCHMMTEAFSKNLGKILDKLGLKAKIKNIIRFRSG
ncbi:GNAT family N-acetyltransferase [Nitrosomonas marina]|uniref:Acetyltransferase (GNAT) domain-containing protein n=1 Tax=Nitrosomonas marina TaxID=917 RepID=A0A1H8HSI7_9PROT|nr:GNAT family N-acetyltransferase [Nitrosomonas marina]SEN59250.1 Acetyltransferase (GNAT) domain-containing protein [Nitrosomonas marina]